MKLSFIFELLVICGLIAFVAGGIVQKSPVGKPKQQEPHPVVEEVEEVDEIDDGVDDSEVAVEDDGAQDDVEDVVDEVSDVSNDIAEVATIAAVPIANTTGVNENDPNPISKYCTCSEATCTCCRDINIPILPIRAPGCAKVQYLEDDKMLVTIQYGDFTIVQRQISGRRATPVCIPLPGGYSRFCGRVYGISRKSENFKACLALELRAEDEVEAALRVNCFQFGPKGLTVAEAEPLPAVPQEDEDDDDDIFGLGGGGGDDDDYEDDDDGAGGGGGGGLAGFLGGLGGGGGFGSGLVSGVAGLFGL